MNIKYNSKLLALVVVFAFDSGVQAKELARVNQKSITEFDLSITLVGMSETQRDRILKDPTLKQNMLLQAINQELLAQDAEKQKLNEDLRFKAELNYQKNLLLLNRLIETKIMPQITEEEARKYYQSHKKEKYTPHHLRLQQILVASEADAKDVLKRTKEPNSDFQAIAETFSIEPNAKNNRGEVGYVTASQLDPTLWEAANQAAVGEIVGPVKNLGGYHLIKIVDRKVSAPLEYEDVETQVRAALRDDLVAKHVAQLRKAAKVYVDQSVVVQSVSHNPER